MSDLHSAGLSADLLKPDHAINALGPEPCTPLCQQVREEAGELCQTMEAGEGRERAAAEMADLLYHAMVLLRLQDVSMAEVMEVLRKREVQSGIEEKAARKAAA